VRLARALDISWQRSITLDNVLRLVGVVRGGRMEPQRITAEEAKRRMDIGDAVVFLDSRADDAWRQAEAQIPNSRRVPPDGVEAHLDEIPSRGLIVPYCT
jgi:hypothetical protein